MYRFDQLDMAKRERGILARGGGDDCGSGAVIFNLDKSGYEGWLL